MWWELEEGKGGLGTSGIEPLSVVPKTTILTVELRPLRELKD
jgi:hypothetical protein